MTEQTINYRLSELPKIESICEQISDLNLGIALVWVYVWENIRDFYDDADYKIKDKETVWKVLVEHISKGESFTLGYGNESLSKHVYDWLTNNDLMVDLTSMESDETDNQDEGEVTA